MQHAILLLGHGTVENLGDYLPSSPTSAAAVPRRPSFCTR